MKFGEMPYRRPDFEAEFSRMQALLKDMAEAQTEEAFLGAMLALDRAGKGLSTQRTLCSIRYTVNTKDPFYSAEKAVFDEETPKFEEINTEAARIILGSPHRGAVERRYGGHLLEKYEVQLKTFRPEILPDLVEENKLSSQYQKLMASAEIEFEGRRRNLSEMTPFMQSPDRETRRRANQAHWDWVAQHADELDALYDRMVKLRDGIGRKLGYDSFIPVAYARMGRTDWTQEDARVYRAQILESVVPLAQELRREQQQRLGIADMKNYDYQLMFQSGNPTPRGGEAYMVEQAGAMYAELSPQTGEFFGVMTSRELMDLTTRPGKRGGGYMTFIADYKVPFIFSNFNGTSGDVDVLTHEAGHAFQGWLRRDDELGDLKDSTSEVAEIHSMSMEFFTHPWMERFFGDDTEKYYYSHVAESLQFLPYGASIDEFQEWVYLNPDATPGERREAYRAIERKYLPHLDYDGHAFLEGGGRWQKQQHVFLYPFYYLDYTLAQVCAFQFFLWDRKDHRAAWDAYIRLCMDSGLVPFTRLVPAAGLLNPFEEGAIAKITPGLREYLGSLDMSKIR